MLYLKQIDNIVFEYPYDISLLYKENLDTSFPYDLTDELLSEYNIYRVKQTPKPPFSIDFQVCEEQTPVLVDGEWCQSWVVRSKTPEEMEVSRKETEVQVRQRRNQLLVESDWVVAKSYEFNEPVPQEWKDYRQALRDIPQQQGFPFVVNYPEKPTL